MLNLTTQHKSGILQGLVVEQPVKLRLLCRSVAVFVLNRDADKQIFHEFMCSHTMF